MRGLWLFCTGVVAFEMRLEQFSVFVVPCTLTWNTDLIQIKFISKDIIQNWETRGKTWVATKRIPRIMKAMTD